MNHAQPAPAVLALLASGGKRTSRGPAAIVLDLIRSGLLAHEQDEGDARSAGFLRISPDSGPASGPAQVPPLRPYAVDAVRPVDPDAGPESFVDPDLVHRALGLQVNATASPPAVGPIRTHILQSTTKPRTSLHVQVASGLAARALRRSGSAADGADVRALGEGRARVDLDDGRILQVAIKGPDSPADRTRMAEQLLRAAVARPGRF